MIWLEILTSNGVLFCLTFGILIRIYSPLSRINYCDTVLLLHDLANNYTLHINCPDDGNCKAGRNIGSRRMKKFFTILFLSICVFVWMISQIMPFKLLICGTYTFFKVTLVIPFYRELIGNRNSLSKIKLFSDLITISHLQI